MQRALPSGNNLRGNAEPKPIGRTLTEECLWLQDWGCRCRLFSALVAKIVDGNEHNLQFVPPTSHPGCMNMNVTMATGLRSWAPDICSSKIIAWELGTSWLCQATVVRQRRRTPPSGMRRQFSDASVEASAGRSTLSTRDDSTCELLWTY
jgi:hypothetical protein